MKQLLIVLLLCLSPCAAQTPPADITAGTVYAQEIIVGDYPQGVHAVISPNGVLFKRDDGRTWAELLMNGYGGLDFPVFRLNSEYLPLYSVEIRCQPGGPPIISYTQGNPVVAYSQGTHPGQVISVAAESAGVVTERKLIVTNPALTGGPYYMPKPTALSYGVKRVGLVWVGQGWLPVEGVCTDSGGLFVGGEVVEPGVLREPWQ